MLTREEIVDAVRRVAAQYPVRAVCLYGSYADGTADERSDVDLYVQFAQSPISVFKVMGFRAKLEAILGKEVDVVKHPPEDGDACAMVTVYEA